MIRCKRAYEPPAPEDGTRVLVDRYWPRGVSKEEAKLDAWTKEVAPGDELREGRRPGDAGGQETGTESPGATGPGDGGISP